ncbi:hypothetical protein [Methylopila sp. 73B]|uniref:hypothetical protein n=1 Tax=Methylopila sp. 73B TaxID=1120792 RepID=UPI0003699CC5|nr:hypothetical protein [Methylopila sp. 73B]
MIENKLNLDLNRARRLVDAANAVTDRKIRHDARFNRIRNERIGAETRLDEYGASPLRDEKAYGILVAEVERLHQQEREAHSSYEAGDEDAAILSLAHRCANYVVDILEDKAPVDIREFAGVD